MVKDGQTEKYTISQPLILNTDSLCSRNFQNVKLRLDFVEIWSFYCYCNFTWNLLVNSNSPNTFIFGKFWDSELWIFGKFGTWKLLKFTKNENSEPLKLPKQHFWTVCICQNLISRKIGVAVKWSNFHKVKPWIHILKVSGA